VATLLDRVREAAERFHQLDAEREQARQELQVTMAAAHKEGVPVARIAREAKVSRPTVHEWLKRGR
jgi:DNA-binding MarR family transcriptional regulator